MTSTHILENTVIDAPCGACEGHYPVTLATVALAQDVMDEGCAATDERECLPLSYSQLADRALVARARRGVELSAWIRRQENEMDSKKPRPEIPDAQKPDTRVLEYVARAPMTYPVRFDLLPPKRRPTK